MRLSNYTTLVTLLVTFSPVVVAFAQPVITPRNSPSTLIRNATLIDGTGSPARRSSVRIGGGRIVEIGALEPSPDDRVIEAQGLVLAPGFIDTHSHHDWDILDRRDALAAVSQGITTIVIGQDGFSNFPLSDYFARIDSIRVAVNVASYVGHNTLRDSVLGKDFRRLATKDEVERMAFLTRQEMLAGALGLSTGLEYDPGIFSNTEEIIALAKEAARLGGRYSSHMRSEDRNFWEALEEVIEVGKAAQIPVQVSHLKLAMVNLWGRGSRVLQRLYDARASGINITADVYPYEYWQSTMTVLFPERDFTNRQTAEFALSQLTTPDGMLIAKFDSDSSYVGKTLAQIARLRGLDPVTTYITLIRESQALESKTNRSTESVIVTAMDSTDIGTFIRWNHSNICSDGALSGRHPRGFGAFPRVVRRYVRESKTLSLEEAVHKMSSLAAEHTGIVGRGVVRTGAWADLVLFDPMRISDRATPLDPHAKSVGISRVWVNGIEVYANDSPTGKFPGVVIRR